MFQVILLSLFIHSPLNAAPYSEDVIREQAALENLAGKFAEFRESIAQADAEFDRLRATASQRQYRTPRTDSIGNLIRTATRQWRAIERYYDEKINEGMELHRPQLRNFIAYSPDLQFYLAFRHNDRFGSGIPLDFALRMWRGLEEGEKISEPPARLRRSTDLDGVKISDEDAVILMTVRGGLIRGRFAGMQGEQMVLREVLSGPLMRTQRNDGAYRILPLDRIARMDVIRRPAHLGPLPENPSVLTHVATYASGFVFPGYVTRLDYRPDDIEMVEMIRKGVAQKMRYRPRVSEVDIKSNNAPDLTHVFFTDCGSLLRR